MQTTAPAKSHRPRPNATQYNIAGRNARVHVTPETDAYGKPTGYLVASPGFGLVPLIYNRDLKCVDETFEGWYIVMDQPAPKAFSLEGGVGITAYPRF